MMRMPCAAALIAAALCVTLLAGCSNAVQPGAANRTPSDPSHALIGLLLPDSVTARYEAEDRPAFVAQIHKRCPGCSVAYQNASADAGKQQLQAESMLARGVDVLVLDPVDGGAAASIVNEAASQGVPVIAYDRLIDSSDLSFYISADNRRVGVLQAQALVDRLRELGAKTGTGILMVNGSQTDHNAKLYEQGAQSVLKTSGLTVLSSFDSPDWSAAQAQTWVAGQITQYGGRIQGVYAANDSLAQGSIAAMQAAGVSPIPVTTGQDAEIAAIQRILTGTQYMTVYKPIKDQARIAADAAIALTRGEKVPATTTTRIGGKDIPTRLLTPLPVTATDVQNVIVDSGFHTAAQICTPRYEQACQEHGIR